MALRATRVSINKTFYDNLKSIWCPQRESDCNGCHDNQ
jgi:hypothetical protein